MWESGEIEELVSRWESRNAQGEAVSLEELCDGRPELIDEVGRRIHALESIDRIMESANISYSTTSRSKDGAPSQSCQQELPPSLGRYRLESLLGSGGFGQVWRAYDPQLERPVAIKIPCSDRMASPALREAFLKEARKVAQLRHPGIVPVHDFGQDGPYYFIVSELVDGGSLADRMKHTRFTWQETVAIVSQVAEALHYAHLRDTVHRDIKPANILLDKTDKPYVTDFGVAVSEDELLEEHGAVSGTLAYMSPEQASGSSLCVNARTDIYSLGVVLYEMLTGRLPFKAKTFDSLRKCIISGEPRTPRTIDDAIPLELEKVCLKAMSKQLVDRFTTASDMANALRNVERPASAQVSALPSAGKPLAVEELAKRLGMPVGELIWKTREILHLEIRTPTSILTATQVARLLENLQSPKLGDNATERVAKGVRRPPLNLPLGDGLSLNLVFVPEGIFKMGSPADEEGHNDDETEHEVRITRPFYMGQYPVTQEQFKRVMRFNPSYFDEPKHPVETVSWFDCVSFCQAVSQMLGRSFRLPTEAEWEYACRAGTVTPFNTGPNISTDQANFDGKFTYGGASAGVSRRQTTAAGSFSPNAWELYDMHGNVWEWCSDWYEVYPEGAVADPQGPPKGEIRVFRGGSWFHGPADCRSAQRDGLDPGRRHSPYGFRIVMVGD